MAPSVIGLGLLEAVSEERILLAADPDDADGDGISGRPNYVWNPDTGRLEIGRFGWTANTATLRRQTADALLNDMGLTSPASPAENHTARQPEAAKFPSGGENPGDPELSEKMLEHSRTMCGRSPRPHGAMPKTPAVPPVTVVSKPGGRRKFHRSVFGKLQ